MVDDSEDSSSCNDDDDDSDAVVLPLSSNEEKQQYIDAVGSPGQLMCFCGYIMVNQFLVSSLMMSPRNVNSERASWRVAYIKCFRATL